MYMADKKVSLKNFMQEIPSLNIVRIKSSRQKKKNYMHVL